jgi:hypothetical protein
MYLLNTHCFNPENFIADFFVRDMLAAIILSWLGYMLSSTHFNEISVLFLGNWIAVVKN